MYLFFSVEDACVGREEIWSVVVKPIFIKALVIMFRVGIAYELSNYELWIPRSYFASGDGDGDGDDAVVDW